MPKKTTNKKGLKSYTGSYRDKSAGIQFKFDMVNFVVTREEFISYLAQQMYTFSRLTTVKGIGELSDGTVIQPRGIRDYYILSGAIAPKNASMGERPTLSDGYKVVIGGRLIVAPNGADDRYVYDCGNINAWTAFYGDDFSRLSARDVLLIHKLYVSCFAEGKATDTDDMLARLSEAKKRLIDENSHLIPPDDHIHWTAQFFFNHDPEMITETSYRHMAVQLTVAIKDRNLTDSDINSEVKKLITENPNSCSIEILPLILAAVFIAEQGRNYTANLTNLALFDLIERRVAIPGVGAIGWLTALATEKMIELFHLNPKDRKGQRQSEIGGWMTMSHKGSQGESRIVQTKFGKMDLGLLPLAQMTGDPHIDMSLVHPLAKMQLAIFNHILAPHQKANSSRDKTFIILSAWLHSVFKTGTIRLLGQKDIRLARQNYTPEVLSLVQRANKFFLFKHIFSRLIAILDHYEPKCTSAYIRLRCSLEDELECILSNASRNDNSQFVAVKHILKKTHVPTSPHNRYVDYEAMQLRHQVVERIATNKNGYRNAITRVLALPSPATDKQIAEYCSRMNQYAVPGDEVTLMAISKLIHRPIVVVHSNELEEITGLVYGIGPSELLDLDNAIALTSNSEGHYDPMEHRTSRELSLLIQHEGPILETVASSKLSELKQLRKLTKLIKESHDRYIYRNPLMGRASAFFTEEELIAAFTPSVDEPEEPEIPEPVKKESLLLAQKQGLVGPRAINGWRLEDVPDVGDCFYHAIIEQMKTMNHPFLANIIEGMAPHLYLRNFLNSTDKGVWAEDKNIDEVVSKIPIILAIVDTRKPGRGYVCYYRDEDDGSVTTHVEPDAPLPDNLPIIRLAATGDHYLSVTSNPILTQGPLKTEFRAPSLRALDSLLFGSRFVANTFTSILNSTSSSASPSPCDEKTIV